MKWQVLIRTSVRKAVTKLPSKMQARFAILLDVLTESGPTGPHSWTNYGKLKGHKDIFHCHLSRSHGYVVCWEVRKEQVVIEIYYAGSHQNAPY